MRFRYYILGAIAIAAVTVYIFKRGSGSAMKKFAAGGPVATKQSSKTKANVRNQPPMYCPEPKILVKKDTNWVTPDDKWQNYTSSSATKIVSFVGAQWVGVRVGKMICLYKTDEAVSFPLALEQKRSKLILEPKSAAWSALVGNRKFCKSTSVADCPYFVQLPKDTKDIYKEIKYAPVSGL